MDKDNVSSPGLQLDRYRALVEQIPAVTYIAALDEISTTIYFSPQIEAPLGFSPGEWTADPDLFRKQLHPDDRERVMAELARSRASGEPFVAEYRLLARDGSAVWFRDEAVVARDEAGNPLFLQGVMLDITGRKRAEEELKRRVGQLTALSSASQAVTASLDPGQVLDTILVGLEQVIPYDSASVLLQEGEWLGVVAARGFPAPEQVVGRRYPADDALFREIRRSGCPLVMADARACPDFKCWGGTDYTRGWMGVPLAAGGKVTGCLTLDSRRVGAYGREDAELVQTFAYQAAIAIQNARLFEQVRAGRERMQALSRRLVEVQESERGYVARELHDGAGQALAYLMVTLGRLEQQAGRPEAVAALVAELQRATQGVWDDLRRLALDLHPPNLERLGLAAALRQHVEDFSSRHGQVVEFEALGFDDVRLPPEVEVALYRIVQEALTNVARHAWARCVEVRLELNGDRVIAAVRDNGVGFKPGAEERGGLGLVGMRERAEMLGGALVVESAIGAGTTVSVEIPL
jgi:PAS domain S-box-containing protein